MSLRDYDQDAVKHYVRYDGWLEACQARNRRVKNAIEGQRRTQPFTYFSFCASQAIDVFMLEKAKLLQRDRNTKRLNHVFFCEENDTEFEKISNLLGSREAGFLGNFKDFVLFEDNADTINIDVSNNNMPVPGSLALRQKLENRRLNLDFRSLFPLDVVNLDICGIFFPPATNVVSPMLEAVDRIFKWQRENQSREDAHTSEGFTLIITTHVEADACNPDVLTQLVNIAQSNIDDYPEFGQKLDRKYGYSSPTLLKDNNFPVFFSIIFPKVIAHVARKHDWFGKHRKIYLYTRPSHPQYHMMCSVVHYERMPTVPHQLPGVSRQLWPNGYENRYLNEICNIVTYRPVDVNQKFATDARLATDVVADLRSIITYRDNLRATLALG